LFGQQSGRQVSANTDVVQGVSTSGVQGTMTVEEALRRLLAGTGLTYTGLTAATITLYRQGAGLAPGALQLDPVQVQGSFPIPSQAMIDNIPPPYAGGQVATGGQLGLLGNRSVMDTPFNQTSYTAKKIQDQQARTVLDVLADDPSVRMGTVDANQNGANVRIRGFNVGNAGTFYGGLYGMLPYYSIMTEIAERVEILKGPSVLLNGMAATGNIGGTINVVPKRAADEPLTEVTADYSSNTQFGGHVDIGRRLGPEKEFGVRLNGVYRGGDTAVEWNSNKRTLGILGLDFRGERVRLAADLAYQFQYIGGALPELGLALSVPLPYAPDARKSQGGPWGYAQRKDAWAVLRGEVDLAENITFYANAGVRDHRDQYALTRGLSISNFNGNATANVGNLSFYFQNLTADGGIRGKAETGPIRHEFALNATTVRQEYGVGFVGGAAYQTNIYNPTYISAPTNLPTPMATLSSVTTLNSIGIADTLSAANNRVQLTVGGRQQQVMATNFDMVSGAPTSNYDKSAFTPAVALVVKPFWDNVSFYGNYVQGLQQGQVVGTAFANAGEIFPPYVTTQYEVGFKIDWGKFTTTASLFQISQPSTIANVATNTLVLAGEQRNQGIEFNVFGEPFEGVRLLGGAMFLQAVLAKTQGGVTDGWIAPFAPGFQFNVGGEWDLPFARGLTVLGRVTYTGSQYIDTTWPRRSLPEWVRLDVGARYTFENLSPTGKPVTIRFNVENVMDSDYWAGGTSASTLALGAPRTFRLALTSEF
jgi:iron complex outermembrane receptor protein